MLQLLATGAIHDRELKPATVFRSRLRSSTLRLAFASCGSSLGYYVDWKLELVPDAFGVQLREHADPEAWFGSSAVAPDVLAAARKDFAPILLTSDALV
jgi:hypothetical protein